MNLASKVAALLTAAMIGSCGISGGIVGQGVLAEQHAAQVAAWEAAIEADAARDATAFAEFASADATFRDNTIATASALVESSKGKASEGAIQALRDAISLHVIPDDDPRGTALVQAQKRAQHTSGVAIQTATETVAREITAWRAAEDARAAAEAEAARAAAEAEAARQAEAQRTSNGWSSDDTSGSSGTTTSGTDSPNTSASSGGGFDPQAAVESAGCTFEWTDSGTSKGGGGPGGGCWVRLSTSLGGDRLWMTTWHEVAHGRLFSQSSACNDAQKSVGIEESAQWWTSTFMGFTVPQHGYPSDASVALLAANCGW